MKKVKSKKALKEMFLSLVDDFGFDNQLLTFEACSKNGLSLDGSTIDCIQVDDSENVIFVFNMNNHDDAENLCCFTPEGLTAFYRELVMHAEDLIACYN